MSPRPMRARIAAGAIGAVALACLPAVGSATSWGASNQAQLASAITNAADGDVIQVQADITLTSALPAITHGILIRGNGYTVSGGGAARVFRVSGTGAGKGVTIVFMTITDGATGSDGAGVMVDTGAVLHLKDLNLVRNVGVACGGFSDSGTLTLDRVSVVGNRSTTGTGGGGGCVWGTLVASNSAFADNAANDFGGALVAIEGSTVTAINSSFTGNVSYGDPTPGADAGGAIGMWGSGQTPAISLVNSLFAYNYARRGSGYVLNDLAIDPGFPVDPDLRSRYSMYGGARPSVIDVSDQDVVYPGAADGSGDTLFGGGTVSAVTNASGVQQGTGTIYRPTLRQYPEGRIAPVPLFAGFANTADTRGTTTRASVAGDAIVAASWQRAAATPDWLAVSPFAVGTDGDLVTSDISYDPRPNGVATGTYTVRGAVQPQGANGPGPAATPAAAALPQGIELAIVTSRARMYQGEDVTVAVRVHNASPTATATGVRACIGVPTGFRVAQRRTAMVASRQACFKFASIAPDGRVAPSILLKAMTGAKVGRTVSGKVTALGVDPSSATATSRTLALLGRTRSAVTG